MFKIQRKKIKYIRILAEATAINGHCVKYFESEQKYLLAKKMALHMCVCVGVRVCVCMLLLSHFPLFGFSLCFKAAPTLLWHINHGQELLPSSLTPAPSPHLKARVFYCLPSVLYCQVVAFS